MPVRPVEKGKRPRHRTVLTQISLAGFKTIRRLEAFLPQSMNVLIGGNGAGKSNFISFFRLMQWMLTPPGQLREQVANNGGASAFLHDGPGLTREITADLRIQTQGEIGEYSFRLFHAADDTFRFAEEKLRYTRSVLPGEWQVLEPGVAEAELNKRVEAGDDGARIISSLIRACVVYQFHNTSATSRMKQRWGVDDGRYLKEDAANLAPFLLRLRDHEPVSYGRIVGAIRQVVPFFSDFVLEPVGNSVLLQWREVGSDVVFSAYQGADGMLRFFALTALLLQPTQDLPDILILDEPELGLHPHACELIGSLLKSVSRNRQVFLATQSTLLVDQFCPEDIVVVNRSGRESEFKRLDPAELKDWLREFEGGRGYSLSELWEKNVLGGGPAA